ncbi:MAG: aerobic carbon-monoxide dehydrogenase large subunit [Actinomycetota bacterium]|jgi:carbon-monoxide dehydrogenase large subunit|nr:aerobic carbon-monoxide dehydrogenase large subunit [Actinomycetota bacterium]
MSTAGRFVGQSVKRREDPRLLTGHGTYVDDIAFPGMLHGAFVRSHMARARIVSIDVIEARALPGVFAVLTAAELNADAGSLQPTMLLNDPANAPLRPLADTDVRFVGEAIVLVVAESRYIAEDACDLVQVELDPQAAVVDFEAAAADTENIVHPEKGTNIAQEMAFPLDAAWETMAAEAAHVVTETFYQHRQTNVPMETRGIVADYDAASNALHAWMSTQNPHEVRAAIARVTGIPEHLVRVTARDVGGGFGQKYFTPREELVVALAARRLGRAVKWIEDRRENLIASNHARVDRSTCTVAVDAEGHILGAYIDNLEDCGAFPVGSTGGVGPFVGMLFPGPYRVPLMRWKATAVWTNTCLRGAYRGPWMMETVAREQMMDVVARAIGLDPLELRRRNVIHATELPYTTAMGMIYDVVTPEETLEQAAGLLDYEAFRAEQERAYREEGRLLGVGIGLYIEPSSMGSIDPLGTETATIRVQPTGKVVVSMGTGSHGQGLETTMPQVVAEELGVPLDDVVLVQGDTESAPFGRGTGGSGSAVIGGGACREAAQLVRSKVLEIAAHLMEAAPADLELVEGELSVRGTPTRTLPFAEVARVAHLDTARLPEGLAPGLDATASYKAPPITWSNACHVCTVELDRHTGLVRIDRYIVSEDCGVMINPMVVEGQIAGGVVQGIGGVLYEHFVYDDDGNPLTTTFLDYLLPTATEVPTIEYGHVETRSNTPGGHKGMGEGGAIGAPPAVFNAVADALSLVGARATRQPLGPSQVLALLD